MRADHPSEPARHATGRRQRRRGLSAALLRARFRAVALVPAAVLGLSAGAVVAWAAPAPLGWGPTASPPASQAPAATGPDVAALGGADGSRSAESVRSAPPTPVASPEPTPSAVPSAVPVADPDAVDAAGLTLADREAGLTSLAVPTSATGDLVVVPGAADAPVPAAGRVVRVRVEVEAGLDIDPARFAATVMTTLNDPRGWGADGSVSFARTDGDADVRVVLASPDTVDDLCAPLETVGRYSCGRNGHAALNHTRWVQGTDEFSDLVQYRQYLVNHEVGHLLGHPHVECPAAGAVAPVMQQQTVGVAPCLPNGWPFP